MDDEQIDVHRLLTPQILARFPEARFRLIESEVRESGSGHEAKVLTYARSVSFSLTAYATPFTAQSTMLLDSPEAWSLYRELVGTTVPLGALLKARVPQGQLKVTLLRAEKQRGADSARDFFAGYARIERSIQVGRVMIHVAEFPPPVEAKLSTVRSEVAENVRVVRLSSDRSR